MSDVFVLRNHDHLYYDRRGEWTDGSESASLYRTLYKDEALNQKLELTVRHPDLRITVVNCRLDSNGRPQLNLDAGHENPPLQEESFNQPV